MADHLETTRIKFTDALAVRLPYPADELEGASIEFQINAPSGWRIGHGVLRVYQRDESYSLAIEICQDGDFGALKMENFLPLNQKQVDAIRPHPEANAPNWKLKEAV